MRMIQARPTQSIQDRRLRHRRARWTVDYRTTRRLPAARTILRRGHGIPSLTARAGHRRTTTRRRGVDSRTRSCETTDYAVSNSIAFF